MSAYLFPKLHRNLTLLLLFGLCSLPAHVAAAPLPSIAFTGISERADAVAVITRSGWPSTEVEETSDVIPRSGWPSTDVEETSNIIPRSGWPSTEVELDTGDETTEQEKRNRIVRGEKRNGIIGQEKRMGLFVDPE